MSDLYVWKKSSKIGEFLEIKELFKVTEKELFKSIQYLLAILKWFHFSVTFSSPISPI